MSESESSVSAGGEYPREYESLDALEAALDDEISQLVDRHLNHAETMADYTIEQDSDRLEVHIRENTTAEWLPPLSGSWGTRAHERWHDVIVDAIQGIGRFHQRRNPEDRPGADGHLILQVPFEDNRGDYAATGGKL